MDSALNSFNASRDRDRHPARAVALLAALVVLIGTQVAAQANTLTMTATDAPTVAVTLSGTDQSASVPFNITVQDSRTTSDGWKLQITSTQFSTPEGKTLSADAASITGVTWVCNISPCSDPSNSIAYPLPVPAGAVAPAPVTFFNAAAGTGTGDLTVTPMFQVRVPANAYAGSYSSTISITIAAGP